MMRTSGVGVASTSGSTVGESTSVGLMDGLAVGVGVSLTRGVGVLVGNGVGVSMPYSPLSVKLVAAADKYHNLSHTLYTANERGKSIWWRFGRGIEQQAWYYRNVSQSILTNVPEPERYPVFQRLLDVIAEIFDGVPSQEP